MKTIKNNWIYILLGLFVAVGVFFVVNPVEACETRGCHCDERTVPATYEHRHLFFNHFDYREGVCHAESWNCTQRVKVPARQEYRFNDEGSWQVGTCPAPVDGTVVTWGECSKVCGGGTQTATETTEAQYCGNPAVTERACNEQSCDEPAECPTECGQPASEVSDGEGGLKQCEATTACVIPTPTMGQPYYSGESDGKAPKATAPGGDFCLLGDVANIFVDQGEPNDGKVEVRWTPVDPKGGWATIEYWTYKTPEFKFSLLATPNDGVQTIESLVNGENYAFRVRQVSRPTWGACFGPYSKVFDPKS